MLTVLKISFIALVLLFTFCVTNVWAQSPVKPADKVLKDTVIRSVSYKLYVGSKGGRYVVRTSKNGLVYKVYYK